MRNLFDTKQSVFCGAVGIGLAIAATLSFAEDCMVYAKDSDRLRCFEANHRSATGVNLSVEKGASTKPPTANERSRIPAPARTQIEVKSRENPEDVNAVLNNLASRELRRDRIVQANQEEAIGVARADKWQSTRLINSCATDHCKVVLTPYQDKVDEFRGQGDSPAKRAAERELQWQLIRHANPP
jgi:hypothetical protein